MINLFLAIIFLSGIFWAIRIQRNKSLALEYRYKFYELRDNLREILIEEKIKSDDWLFDFFDNSFSKVVDQLEIITIYKAIYLTLLHRNDENVKSFIENFQKSLVKNKELQVVYNRYGDLLLSFFKEKHKTLIRVIYCCHGSVAVFSTIKSIIVKYILALRLLPETSGYSLAH